VAWSKSSLRAAVRLCIFKRKENEHLHEEVGGERKTHEEEGPVIHQLVKPALRAIVLRREPRLDERRAIIALDELAREPGQRCEPL
jgi:hypothetical protein